MQETEVRTKAADEVFCQSCGAAIKAKAVICPRCGVAASSQSSATPKDKTVAVLLAVFLGFWTWCYTYKRDAWKFWLNLVLTVLTLGIFGLVAWIWAIIDVAVKPGEYYSNFPNQQ